MNKKDLNKKKPQYPNLNEYKSRKFLNIATAVGIGVSAAAVSLELDAEEKKVAESKKTENTDHKKVKDQIILLAANLGHDDFKEREKATQSLVAVGQNLKKSKNKKMTEFLTAELKKCSKSKDPEVKERAKKILLAITPPPPKPANERIYRTAGIMIAPQ